MLSSAADFFLTRTKFKWQCLYVASPQWGDKITASCYTPDWILYSSVQFSRSVMSDSLRPHESQHTRPPCPLPSPGVHANSRPSNRWCHPAISSSVVPFSSCPQSLPASGSFPISQLFAWGGQSIGVSASASVLPMNVQDWSPLEWTGWISCNCGSMYKHVCRLIWLLLDGGTFVCALFSRVYTQLLSLTNDS